jgi:hypothetical protein
MMPITCGALNGESKQIVEEDGAAYSRMWLGVPPPVSPTSGYRTLEGHNRSGQDT